jgi:hypothetical protein
MSFNKKDLYKWDKIIGSPKPKSINLKPLAKRSNSTTRIDLISDNSLNLISNSNNNISTINNSARLFNRVTNSPVGNGLPKPSIFKRSNSTKTFETKDLIDDLDEEEFSKIQQELKQGVVRKSYNFNTKKELVNYS